MLMKEELAKLVIEGVKTQTRRPIKSGESLVTIDGVTTVMAGNGKRIKYQVGREYSLQYGRGLPTRYWHKGEGLMDWEFYQDALAQEGENFHKISGLMGWKPLKIKLLDICEEDVRTISEQDAICEGFEHPEDTARWGFIETWAGFYDKPIAKAMKSSEAFFMPLLNARPEKLYLAWALKFEVVR
jgi:hypothetical protein